MFDVSRRDHDGPGLGEATVKQNPFRDSHNGAIRLVSAGSWQGFGADFLQENFRRWCIYNVHTGESAMKKEKASKILVVRVQPALRDEFLRFCEQRHKTVSETIREMMWSCIAK